MSKEVVEYLHGQMHIDSVEEQYTEVTILLPLKEESFHHIALDKRPTF